jgi:hypothetical protein
MPVNVAELREICQKPVEGLNDLTGRLYGSRVSIHITRLFLGLGLGANTATAGMFAVGLAGAGLLLLPGWWRVVGFACLVLHYLLDCVDGELARYHRTTSLEAAYVDYLAHGVVRSSAWLALGTTLAAERGSPWPFRAAVVATIGGLLLKTAEDLPALLFAKKLSAGQRPEPRAAAPPPPPPWQPGLRATVRSLLINWDLAMLYFAVAATLDAAGWVGRGGAELSLLCWYAIALPLQLLDTVRSDLVGGRLAARLTTLRASLAEPPAAPRRESTVTRGERIVAGDDRPRDLRAR